MTIKKKEGSSEYPASAYLVVGDPEQVSTWHLRVRDESGKPDHRLMGAAYAALYENYRGHSYAGPNVDTATKKLKELYASEGILWPAEAKASVIAIKAGDNWELDVLGVPFGGPFKGKDKAGEFFSDKSIIHQDKFPEVPAIYAHGLDPNTGRPSRELHYLGKARYDHKNERGHWYKTVLDKSSQYAQKIWDAALKGMVGASSGTSAHLVRMGSEGHIDEWPVIEMTLVESGLPVSPVNPYAIALPALKASYHEAGMELHVTEDNQAEEATNAELEKQKLLEQERKAKMEDPNNTPETSAIEKAFETAQAEIKAVNEAKAAKEKQEQEIDQKVKELVREAMKAAPAIKGGGSAALNLKTQRGDSETKAFWYWFRTGDREAYKANITLNEGDDEQGGALVPHDFSARIREKRDEASIIRLGGCEIITTSLKIVDIPVEGTAETAPAATNESAGATPVSYDMNAVEPLDTVTATLVKYTRLHRISEELVNDQKADLEAFLTRRVGRAFAKLENTLFFTAATSGSVVNVSGKGKDAATATGVAVGDITGLYYSLPDFYRDGAIWVTATATEGLIRTIAGNPFYFMPTPQGERGDAVRNPLMGHSLFNTAAMSAVGASAKSVFFGNLNYYTVAENPGFVVRRLNERFADTGEVGYIFSQRIAGVANQTEALKHLLHPSA